ncbi:MAG: magnesium/cobalt transporter CorA [Acidobacteriota bacterium]
MLTIVACDAEGKLEEAVTKDRLAALLKSHGTTVWVDLSGPIGEESGLLTSAFHVHPLAIEDCETRRHHPKIDDYGSHLFILSHGVHPESSAREFKSRQLSAFVGPNYLVTCHREPSRSVQATLESVRRNPRLMAEGPGMILYRVLDFQVDLYLPLMEIFQKRIDEIEKECFAAPTSAILQGVFDLRKALVRLRRFSGHQREILLRLSRREFPLIDERSAVYLRDVYDHLVRITDLADSYRELVAGALEAHLSIVSNRTNEIMRVLTVITTLFIPLTFIAGIYGMNFDMPEFHWKHGYLFAYALMAVVGAGMYFVFRRRGIFRRPGR